VRTYGVAKPEGKSLCLFFEGTGGALAPAQFYFKLVGKKVKVDQREEKEEYK